jgi:hypothetical protein
MLSFRRQDAIALIAVAPMRATAVRAQGGCLARHTNMLARRGSA